ncbi:MAG: zinc-ribbon domain-containing protein [Chloroflexota bacterium]|nr:zinc-ribbon domain-containing protein [Chloroflexota bacterium]
MSFCPNCGAEIAPGSTLCSECGSSLLSTAPAEPTQLRHPWARPLLWLMLTLLLLIGSLASSAYFGLHYGERDRETALQAIVEEHYQNGVQALNAGKYELARANFQYVLKLEATHPLAQQGLAESDTRLAVQPTPTSAAQQSLVEQHEEQLAELWAQAAAAYKAAEWSPAASTLTQLRALDAEYRPAEIEELLFTSLYSAGKAYLEADNLEQGIFYLDQAIALRPLEADLVNRRNLAARYLAALGFWGVDWEEASAAFAELCAVAPNYKDVYSRLYRSHVAYGDQLSGEGEFCPAEIAYSEALRMVKDEGLETKRATAAQTCLLATPVPREGAQPVLTPQAIPGFTVGRLAYPIYDSTSGTYDIYALYANGRILPVAQNADHPWWEKGTGRVIYRDRTSSTISMVLPEEGIPQQLTSPDGRAWPILSPDGQRMAYAAQNAQGVWTIYLVNTYAGDQPQALAPGWSPAWSSTGQLAYTGCTAGEEQCGIIIDNPDDDQPGTRLTNSIGDTAVSWSPAGNLLAYMTNITGNWDVMLLNPGGGVSQFTYETSDEGLPAWAPDGSGVAFVSNRGGTWAIYVADTQGKNVRRILDLGVEMPAWDDQRLSWSP